MIDPIQKSKKQKSKYPEDNIHGNSYSAMYVLDLHNFFRSKKKQKFSITRDQNPDQ